MEILVLNGPNINMLGKREPELYGKDDYNALVSYCKDVISSIGAKGDIVQTNYEGELVTIIQEASEKYDGIVINPGAYTHTSIAILDAVLSINIPVVEVHITDPDKREDFRKISYIRQGCKKTFKGLGFEGYKKGIEYIKDYNN